MTRKKSSPDNSNTDTQNVETVTQNDNIADASIPSFEELLELSEKKASEYKDMAQRIQAEFENYKRRNSELSRTSRLDGTIDTLKEFIPILDNLERACDTISDESIKNGVSLIFKQLNSVFEKLNVKEIESLGCEFNPSLHNAVMQVEDSENKGKVVEVFQKGYIKDGKVLRYAMVKVGN